MNRLTKMITCAAAAAVMTVSSTAALSVSADWVKTSGGYAYTNEQGEKLSGWNEIDGGKYYFGKDGNAVTGFKKIGGKTYYFMSSKKGKMATGWKTISDKKYYFGKDGVMRTGLKKIGGKNYLFDSKGVLQTKKVTVDGYTYTFNSDGSVKSKKQASSDAAAVSPFKSKILGKGKFGMSLDKFISANSIGDYEKLSNETVTAIRFKADYLGASNADVGAIFDETDKLVGIVAVCPDSKDFSKLEKKAAKLLGDPITSTETYAAWMDSNMNTYMLGTADMFGVDGSEVVFVAVSLDFINNAESFDISSLC